MVTQKRNYWTDEKRLSELKDIIEQIGHFPVQHELEELGRHDLKQTIARHGGLLYYRDLLGIDKWKKPITSDFNKSFKDLNALIKDLNHFPSTKELIDMNKYDILYFLRRTGGINKYRYELGYKPIIVEDGHYTLEQTINEIHDIENQIGHFPTLTEIKKNKEWCKVSYGIKLNGGINNIRKIMGYSVLKERNGYNSKEIIKSKVQEFINTTNCFPTRKLLEVEGNTKLISAISCSGGFNYYRKIIGFRISKQKNGFWDYNKTYSSLKDKINVLGYYPNMSELDGGLVHAILKHGGNIHFRTLFGYKVDYWSEMCSYFNKRGKNTEKIVLSIINDYCSRKQLKEPILNKKFKSGKRIEFVCDVGKSIGIDVVNTRSLDTIKVKWLKRDYHKYLDELIIVVFSNNIETKEYKELNHSSPENVSIISIEEFCKMLEYSLTEESNELIEKYKSCTFSKKKEKEVLI